MHSEEKRQLDELIALYAFEGDLKDIYVEGRTDKDMIESFLVAMKRDDIQVYTIDDIDVPETEITSRGFGGRCNRARVIVLSQLLEESSSVQASVLCIADRDFEDYLPSAPGNGFLALTDFNSIESYALQDRTMHKFVNLAVGHLPVDSQIFLPQVHVVLKDFFYMRLANECLSWGMKWLNPSRYLTVSRDLVYLDVEGFTNAYLRKNSKISNAEEFGQTLTKLKLIQPSDPRLAIRGHDLVSLLQLVAKKLKSKRKFGDEEFFGCALLATIEAADVQQFPLFARILQL